MTLDRNRARWTVLELSLFLILLCGHLWYAWQFLPIALKHRSLASCLMPALAGFVIVGSFFRMPADLESLGLNSGQWKLGWPGIAVFTAASLLVLALLCLFWKGAIPQLPSRSWFLQYVPGLVAQQVALQCFVNNRLYAVFAQCKMDRAVWFAVLGSSALFAILHVPNVVLTIGTAGTAIFWTWHYRTYRNLIAVILSHLMLGTSAMSLLGDGPLLRLRVGLAALHLMLRD